jgi:dephospho-CoA kinase
MNADMIALFGPMCVGKSYAADILVKDYGYSKMAFANQLKEEVARLFGLTGKDGHTRKVLQEFSADCKKYRPNIWIELLQEKVVTHSKTYTPSKIVVDDLRFKIEANVLRDMGFIIVLVDLPEDIRMRRVNRLYPDTDPASHAHASEQEWKEIVPDYVVSGEGWQTQEDIDDLIVWGKGRKS